MGDGKEKTSVHADRCFYPIIARPVKFFVENEPAPLDSSQKISVADLTRVSRLDKK